MIPAVPENFNQEHQQLSYKCYLQFLVLLFLTSGIVVGQNGRPPDSLPPQLIEEASAIVDQEYSGLENLYKHLHAHPELSFQEVETARIMASQLRKQGFLVTENVGGNGVVGVLKNGDGPTVMIRTDMDALPIREETGLPYASKVETIDADGTKVPVMHACGHDLHMAIGVGAAKVLNRMRDKWSGTLVLIAQPAEEKSAGARAMLEDGLYTRFPRPDYGLALHVNAVLEAGQLGYTSGHALANVDNIRIKVKGKGGHGAAPHTTIDPVTMAAKVILGLQSITARELSPIETPAVLSVGSIHGGTSGNVIPNEVDLELTIRSYGYDTRQLLIDKVMRVTRGVAIASGVPEEDFPVVEIREPHTPSVYNNPALTATVAGVFRQLVGSDHVAELDPLMVGEDFGHYTRAEPSIPMLLYSLGTMPKVDPLTGEKPTYFTHSSRYRPQLDPSLKVGVMSMSLAVMKLCDSEHAISQK